jgi:hypothetical protein
MKKDADLAGVLIGPPPIAYVEQARAAMIAAGGELGRPVPVDLCVWKLGDAPRRDVTKIGGVPYWPAGEPWPHTRGGAPATFVAQFSFADSTDLLPNLPGDLLSVLAANDDYQSLALRWFRLGEKRLLPPAQVPAPRWVIHPCHAVLHRTAEYPEADWQLFEEYPYPLRGWAREFLAASKIGGHWRLRGHMESPEEQTSAEWRREMERAWAAVRAREKSFVCQLASVQAAGRRPFLNVARARDLFKAPSAPFLMIADVGVLDFFYRDEVTDYEWWSG